MHPLPSELHNLCVALTPLCCVVMMCVSQMSRETGRDASVSHHILKNPMTGFAEVNHYIKP